MVKIVIFIRVYLDKKVEKLNNIQFRNMKKGIKLMIGLVVMITLVTSCKMLAKGALKYWTKQQVQEFTLKCEKHASLLASDEKAKEFCSCAVDVVAKEYKNYEDVKNTSIKELLKVAKDCK